MTKNGRRGLFLLVATLGNLILTVIIIVALLAIWSLVSGALKIQEATMGPAIIVAFVGAIVLSGFIYSRVLKAVQKRPDLVERYGLLK
jgi:hypothetical protein